MHAAGGGTLKLFGMDGKLLFTKSINKENQSFPWSHNGIFIVSLLENGKIYTAKIVSLN